MVAPLACSSDTLSGDSDNDFGYVSKPSTVLYIYAGANEKDYLGKLNASRYDSESIWNPYGTYGNKYNSKSIWNQYGTYGNKYKSNRANYELTDIICEYYEEIREDVGGWYDKLF